MEKDGNRFVLSAGESFPRTRRGKPGGGTFEAKRKKGILGKEANGRAG